MNFENKLISGLFVKRYKRFFVDIKIDNKIVTAHCPNTGSMLGLLKQGNKVWVSRSNNPKRKLKFTLEIIEDKKDEPQYKEVSKFVGGMVECITFPNGDLLLINEEGKLMGLPFNPEASALWKAMFDNDNFVTGRQDFVVGPAILIKKDALKYWAD